MVIRTQNWRPDTCNCVISQRYDDMADPIVVENTGIAKCSIHGELSEADAISAVVEENIRKNQEIASLVADGASPNDIGWQRNPDKTIEVVLL